VAWGRAQLVYDSESGTVVHLQPLPPDLDSAEVEAVVGRYARARSAVLACLVSVLRSFRLRYLSVPV
jgi:hypothetical protein